MLLQKGRFYRAAGTGLSLKGEMFFHQSEQQSTHLHSIFELKELYRFRLPAAIARHGPPCYPTAQLPAKTSTLFLP